MARVVHLLTFAGLAAGQGLDYSFAGRGSADAVTTLLARVLGADDAASLPFRLTLVDACAGAPPSASKSSLCFELADGVADDDGAALIDIRGTSAPDLARGAATYLRERCDRSILARRGMVRIALLDDEA